MSTETDFVALIGDTANRFLRDQYGFTDRRPDDLSRTFDRDRFWAAFMELGCQALLLPEDADGAAQDVTAALPVLEALGQEVLTSPFAVTAAVAPLILGNAEEPLRTAILKKIAAGLHRLAMSAEDLSLSPSAPPTTLEITIHENTIALNGTTHMVIEAGQASAFLLRASRSGSVDRFVFIPAHTPGISLTDYNLYDGSSAATIQCRDVNLPSASMIVVPDDMALNLANRFALCAVAEGLGTARRLWSELRDYLGLREAFSQRLSNFQVLRHRIVDMVSSLNAIEAGLAMLVEAESGRDDRDRRKLIHTALSEFRAHGIKVGKEAVQLHGAIGAMQEHVAAAGLTRLTVLNELAADQWGNERAMKALLQQDILNGTVSPLF